jgi:hypothetical protein
MYPNIGKDNIYSPSVPLAFRFLSYVSGTSRLYGALGSSFAKPTDEVFTNMHLFKAQFDSPITTLGAMYYADTGLIARPVGLKFISPNFYVLFQ